jgi:mevalonate kinase
MSTEITVSAPAKLFILGEHAVVFDGTCIVTAVDARLYVKLSHQTEPRLYIDAPDVGLVAFQRPLTDVIAGQPSTLESAFIESCVRVFHEKHPISTGIRIETYSEFKREYGIGSSSAVVAAALFGLAQLFEQDFTKEELLKMGVGAIQRVQSLGSGADLAAAIYGGTLYYVNHEPRRIELLAVRDLPLLVVYSGHKASTRRWVEAVGDLQHRWPMIVNPVVESMLAIVETGKAAILTQDWSQLGTLMNIQHGLLHALGVDTASLSQIVHFAREQGAYGAKLSGAGGGDCAIILCDPDHITDMRARLADTGYKTLELQANADGVRLESDVN